jgi:hypothetical protein
MRRKIDSISEEKIVDNGSMSPFCNYCVDFPIKTEIA